jgi:hypothetical protein
MIALSVNITGYRKDFHRKGQEPERFPLAQALRKPRKGLEGWTGGRGAKPKREPKEALIYSIEVTIQPPSVAEPTRRQN